MVPLVEEPRTRTAVAKVIEVSSESTESFDDAIRRGIAKASETVHGIRGTWIKSRR
jgi:dodecin